MISLRQQIEETFGLNIDLSGGLRGSFLAPVYLERPDFFPYQVDGKISLRKTIEGWQWPAQSDYVQLVDFPEHQNTPYATKLQGVTHFEDRCWLFSQDPDGVQGKLTSVDVRQNLVIYPPSTSTVVEETNRPFNNNHHFGDCASDGDLLVVPSHDQQPNIAVFYSVFFSTNDKNDDAYYKPVINYLGNSRYQAPQNLGGTSVPWNAIVPSKLMYSSGSTKKVLVSSFFRDYPTSAPGPETKAGPNMFLYELNVFGQFPTIVNPGLDPNNKPITYPIEFKDKGGNTLQPRRIQGGVVSDAGHLYISCDLALNEGIGGGVHGFDLATGRRIIYLPIDGHQTIAGVKSFEIEGIDIWDVDDISNADDQSKGQIHMTVLDPDWPSADEAYILHWRVTSSKRDLI